ncbi:MAG: hypothetical protein C5B47_08860 [Verrucomicrobia bacterium]|nr:MAG: hypothetical protein C5B47_08860 [Verrucomicrobiota bacterium]
MKTISPSNKVSFPFQRVHDTLSHQQIYSKLNEAFDDKQSRIMSEVFIDLLQHLDDKLAQYTTDILEVINTGFLKIENRFLEVENRFLGIENRFEVNDRRFDELEANFSARLENHTKQITFQMTAEIYKAINTQTWKLFTATIASWGVFAGILYAFMQKN